jgi:DNA-binding CsgD family transcriptional regulator
MVDVPEFEPGSTADLLRSIVEWAATAVGVDGGEIHLYDPLEDCLVLRFAYGMHPQKHLGATFKPGQGLAGKVFASGKPLIVEDYAAWEGRDPDSIWSCTEFAVPMRCQGQTIGVLVVVTDSEKRVFSERDAKVTTMCASLAAVAIENMRLREQLEASLIRLRATLQEEIQEHTDALAKRAVQLQGGVYPQGEISAGPGIDDLMQHATELKIARKVLARFSSIPLGSSASVDLTPRETEVLSLIARGRVNKEIAQELVLSVSTVKYHLGSILKKLQVMDRTQAAIWATQHGMGPSTEEK